MRVAICSLFVLLVACNVNQPERARAIGEAYVGPATLNLRKELTPKAEISATAKHGDKLEVLENRRRFMRLRTAAGVEGWADSRQLLTTQQMAELRTMAESTSQYPSQGAATVFEPLNMHTEPNRSSPSFWQIPDNVKVDVIGHKLAPRTQAAPPPPPKQAPVVRARKKGKGGKTQAKIAPPPTPPAPKPPENWLELSVPREDELEPAKPEPSKTAKAPAAPAAPVPLEDWSLVRTKDGKVGWVLTRALNMAIPDEVAQYAEGHRITSYFALGQVKEGDSEKPNWLWTTIVKGREPYEFDSFRVFVWSHKHHRYETAYIERRVVGHYPVQVDTSGSVPSFSVLLEDNGAQLYRKTYTFEGYRVHMVKKEPYQAQAQAEKPQPAAPAQEKPQQRPWYSRLKDRMKTWWHRL